MWLDVGAIGSKSLFSFGSGWTFAIRLFVFIFIKSFSIELRLPGGGFSTAPPLAILGSLAEIMKDLKLKIIFGLLSIVLFIGLICKLRDIPGGMILPGYFIGGITLIGVIIVSVMITAIAKQIFKSFSFLTLFAITTTIAFISFHFYLYSPTLKIIVPKGYTGKINLVLSNVDNNILTVDSNGIGYLNKWTFEKTYSKPIVQQIDGQNLDSNCVGFNPSTFLAYSKFCCVEGKTIKSLSFKLERKNDSGQSIFQAKGFSQYVDAKKLYKQ